jgi:hypothetical protein
MNEMQNHSEPERKLIYAWEDDLQALRAEKQYALDCLHAAEEHIAQMKAALWPFAMKHRIGAGYCADDFRRASECFPAEPTIIEPPVTGD